MHQISRCIYLLFFCFRNVSHPRLLKIVSSFNEAISLCGTKPLCDDIDSIWIMGGANIFKVGLIQVYCIKPFTGSFFFS